MKKISLIACLLLVSAISPSNATDLENGKAIAKSSCVACHAQGVMGAPKVGDTQAWTKRVEQGLDKVINNLYVILSMLRANIFNPIKNSGLEF